MERQVFSRAQNVLREKNVGKHKQAMLGMYYTHTHKDTEERFHCLLKHSNKAVERCWVLSQDLAPKHRGNVQALKTLLWCQYLKQSAEQGSSDTKNQKDSTWAYNHAYSDSIPSFEQHHSGARCLYIINPLTRKIYTVSSDHRAIPAAYLSI